MTNGSIFIMERSGGMCRIGSTGGKYGFAAADILRMEKKTVSALSALYNSISETGGADRAKALVSDIGWLCCAFSEMTAEELRRAVDELICFRVYIRYFLTKCRDGVSSDADSLARFLEKLPELEKALKKDGMTARTVMPRDAGVKMSWFAENGEIKERCEFESLIGLLLFDFMQALKDGTAPKICPCCGRYFLPERSNRLYCDGKTEDGRLCRDVGALRAHTGRVNSDALHKACRAACGRIYTRKCRGKLTAEEADALAVKCRSLLKAAEAEQMPLEKFEEQLCKITG